MLRLVGSMISGLEMSKLDLWVLFAVRFFRVVLAVGLVS